MKYAIIEASGRQFWIEERQFYDFNRLSYADPGDRIRFKRVLLFKDGDSIEIGTPCVTNAVIEATVMRHLKGKKIIIFKRKPKKNSGSKNGHRQPLTRVMINSIQLT